MSPREPRASAHDSAPGRRSIGWLLLVAVAVGASATCSAACKRGAELARRQAPEGVWLSRIGTGPAETARMCGRGATDRVATVLCAQPPPPIHGLDDLYRALRLGEPSQRQVAAATHSLGLSARTVSGVNPRVLVFENMEGLHEPPKYEQIVAAGFTRGEQLVELLGLDPATYEYNFYLLRFEQPCNRSRCTPEDLLTDKIERGWTEWTLYSDRDLEDTPLDCVSCHQPFGTGTHKQMLMRQVTDPWMHWSDFRGGDERFLCGFFSEDGSRGKVVVTAEGLDVLLRLEGTKGRYAGVPLPELHAAESGRVVANFLVTAEQSIRTSSYPHDYPYAQIYFQTREVLCERFHTGTSATWNQERRESLARGLPVPYYGPDVIDPERSAEVLGDRDAFLRRHADDDAFNVAASFIAADVATAVGFVPREEDAASEILRSMCVRCHAADTDPRLLRSRFNAQSIDRIDPATALAIRRRLSLPRTSPELMPPLRVGELPSWAIARIERYLRDHCEQPGTCD
jgi:hypothetical protein